MWRSTRTRPPCGSGSPTNGAAVSVEVSDDGVGGADPANGSGLRGLADRVEALGGSLEVVSPAGRRNIAMRPDLR